MAGTILVVDDNAAQRYCTGKVLCAAGYNVVETATGAETVRLATELAAAIDVIVLDIGLPDISGFEVCAQLKGSAATAHIPIIYLTATWGDMNHRLEGLKQAEGYLVQPVRPEELLAMVRIWLRVKRAEEASARLASRVAEQAHSMEALLSASLDHIYMFDGQGRYTYANRAACRALGLEPHQIVGHTWAELGFDPAMMAPFAHNLAEVFRTGHACRDEIGFPLRSRERYYDYILTPIMTGDAVGSVVAVVRDITARKRSEHDRLQLLQRERTARYAAEMAEKRVSAVLESITDAVFTLDAEWKFTYLNPEAERVLRASQADLLGRVVWDVFPQADEFRRHYEAVVHSGKADHFEAEYAPLNIWFEVHAYPSGEGLAAYFRDITERRSTQQALLASEEFNRRVIESSRDCIKVLDRDGRLLFMSPGGQRLLGFTPATVPLGKSWIDFWQGEDRRHAVRAVVAAREGGEGSFHGFCPNADGVPKWWEVVVNPIRDASGNIERLLATSRDITERKQTEEMLRRNEKLAATGRLAATLAHEINNPLAAVTNILYLLQQDAGLSAGSHTLLQTAEQELARTAHITRQMLGFYRESQQPGPLRLHELLDNVLLLYRRKIEAANVKVEPRYEYAGEVVGYGGEMRQVFSNLIANAVDALADTGGGRLRLHVFACHRGGNGNARAVRVTIADTGPGIACGDRSKIFEPFYSTKGEKGTGLGLWVTQGIVHKHGGEIRVRTSTEPGRSGTCFSILFPLSAAASRDLAASAD